MLWGEASGEERLFNRLLEQAGLLKAAGQLVVDAGHARLGGCFDAEDFCGLFWLPPVAEHRGQPQIGLWLRTVFGGGAEEWLSRGRVAPRQQAGQEIGPAGIGGIQLPRLPVALLGLGQLIVGVEEHRKLTPGSG